MSTPGITPPLLLKRSSCRRLHAGGVPLGIIGDVDFSTGEELLEPHDLLVFYSDGITEAGHGNGREFSVERLERIVTAARDQPLPELQSRVLGEVRAWTKMELEDDLTLVLARVL
ncbi:MAG: PP2C family protein-serine/threonine phosphatase [Acidobacteriota bacterium]